MLLGLPLTADRLPRRDYCYAEEHRVQLAGTYSPPTRFALCGRGLEAHLNSKRYRVRMYGPYEGVIELYGLVNPGMQVTFMRNDAGDVFAAHFGARMMLTVD